MKIAHVSSTFPPDKGGMGNATYHMAVESAKSGHEIVIFTPLYRGIEELSCHDIKVVRLGSFIKYGKAAFLPQLIFKLRDFDIIHLHYPFFGASEAVWFMKKMKSKIKFIVSYHMDEVGRGIKSAIYKLHSDIFLSRIISIADRVIVSSYDYADSSEIRDIVSRDKMVEIPYGVDERFIPGNKDKGVLKRWGINSDEIVLLFIGGLEYFKGIDFLIRSIPSLKGKIKLLIAGKGPQMEFCRSLARNLKITDRVYFTGFISDEELVRYYNLCDIFVLPSIDRSEAFGIVLIEAMACGKPVISSNLPGIRTVVDDGINGFLAAPGNVADLAKKIQLLIDNEGLRREFGEKGRGKVLKKYNWQKVSEKLNEVYAEVMKEDV